MEDLYKSLATTNVDDWSTLESILFSTEFLDRYKSLNIQHLIDFCETYIQKIKDMITISTLRIPRIPITILENEYWTIIQPPTFLTLYCTQLPENFPIYIYINDKFFFIEEEIDLEYIVFSSTHIFSPFEFVIYDMESITESDVANLDDVPSNTVEECLAIFINYFTTQLLDLQNELKLRITLSTEIEKKAIEEKAVVEYTLKETLADMKYVEDFITK